MSRRLMRISLALVILLSSEVWAIGLGDINLDSALNEPLRAEIELLSATPEELANLAVTLASAETFTRYGIDRPFYLQDIEFSVDQRDAGAVILVGSRSPITEPFLTFLVEATWSSGRLLREYTVLLDPPTYAPPAVQETPAVQAPRRAMPTDSARIERQPPPPPRQEPQPAYTPPPRPAPSAEPAYTAQPEPSDSAETPYSTAPVGDYLVERGDTLWGIASRMRPDSRLTMNQTMLAIYEANPAAFSGNINRLKAGAALSIPSADDVFQIGRRDAFSEVRRQNEAWGGVSAPETSYADTRYDEPGYTATEPDTSETTTSLVLVPPDEEPAGVEYDDTLDATEAMTREEEIEHRIGELEAADVPDQQSLIEIRDNELAALRQELAEIRGETYEPPVDEAVADDEAGVDDLLGEDEIMADTEAEDAAAEDEAEEPQPTVPTNIVTTRVEEPGIVDRILEILGSWWIKIGAAVVLAAGVLLWFVRRGRDDEDEGPWETLDKDEPADGAFSATETLRAPRPDDAIVVVEQDSGIRPIEEETIEAPAPDIETEAPDIDEPKDETGQFDSLEDTFSSYTAVNLDQTDPLAEADFHMAYGLYDQAADLVNGALETDPNDQALMSKLCEIYFVWGNRDAFVDAAQRLRDAAGDGESAEWDKIVIMGQQIADDHELFAGAAIAGATKAVDLSFEDEMGDAGELDIDFGDDDAGASDIVDLGAEASDDGVDFLFDEPGEEPAVDEMLEATAESPTVESDLDMEVTSGMPAQTEPTVETPTIEQQFGGMEGTSELPSLDESLGEAIADAGQDSEATAEINLDELDLDVDGLADVGAAELGDLDETELADLSDLEETGTNEALTDLADITGKNPEVDPDATDVQRALDAAGDADATGIREGLDFDDLGTTDTGMRLAPDETGHAPLMDADTDTSIDADLLDATGHTQILSEDMAVETASDIDEQLGDDDATMIASGYGDEDTEISSDAETLLAPLDDDDDFDFANTEALPPDVFTGDASLDETGEMPEVAGTDVDLDLDDLTEALKVSDVGDTVEQLRDDATVEQPRPSLGEGEETAEVPTMSLGPEDMSEDLHEARTMTEVGTKLDLARAYVDMGDPAGARSILEEVLDEGDEGQRQQAQQLLDSLPG